MHHPLIENGYVVEVLRLRDRPHASDFIVAEAADTTVAEVSIWAGTTVADLRKCRRLGTIAKSELLLFVIDTENSLREKGE